MKPCGNKSFLENSILNINRTLKVQAESYVCHEKLPKKKILKLVVIFNLWKLR